MTIKFLPVIIGLSVSVAATSIFASHLSREEDELQRVLALSLNDYHHVEDEVDSSALALQIAHDAEEAKRARAEEEEFQRILALSINSL
jgi:hypothetical protein